MILETFFRCHKFPERCFREHRVRLVDHTLHCFTVDVCVFVFVCVFTCVCVYTCNMGASAGGCVCTDMWTYNRTYFCLNMSMRTSTVAVCVQRGELAIVHILVYIYVWGRHRTHVCTRDVDCMRVSTGLQSWFTYHSMLAKKETWLAHNLRIYVCFTLTRTARVKARLESKTGASGPSKCHFESLSLSFTRHPIWMLVFFWLICVWVGV